MARPGRPRKAGRRWFAVYTNARQEWLASRLLQHEGYETLYLHYRDTVNHARATVEVRKPYFPRYLFVGVEGGQSIGDVNRTMGVSEVVRFGEGPLEIPSAVIEELRSRGDEDGMVNLPTVEKRRRKLLESGEVVRVHYGSFAGLMGVVALDMGREVRIWLEMFKGRVSVDFLPDHISPALRSSAK